MKKQSLFRQTVILSGANFLVRALGFVMRIIFSRLMGAQAVGLMELSSGVHALLITPVTSGVPLAVSRLVAQRQEEPQRRAVLRTAMKLAFAVALAIFFISLPLLPIISRLLGDMRTLPSLAVFLPCVPVLALSAALNGYHYGCGSTLAPALSELAEQLARFAVTLLLLTFFPHAVLAARAAFPAAGTLLGETAGLLLMMLISWRAFFRPAAAQRGIATAIVELAAPVTLMRLFSTAMRTVNAVMIPARLQTSGLSAAEATSLLGMLNGMAMPLMMTPSFITGALAMVSAPALAQRQSSRPALRRITRKTLAGTLLICAACMAVIFFFSDFFAVTLYRQNELSPLLRFLCPLVLVMGLHQVVNAMLSGLGLQRHALYASITGSAFSLAGTYLLAAQPGLRLYGCAMSMMLGQLVTLGLNLVTLRSGVTQSEETNA